MSVKKFIITKAHGNFTTIPNKVLQNLHDYEALGLYAYLASLPTGWTFYKDYLRKQGNIGRNKLDKLLKILEKHGLIKTAQLRNEKGAFAHFDLQVDDGDNFKINNLEEFAQPFTQKPLTDNGATVNSSYKRNIEKENINKKENIKNYCAFDNAHAQTGTFSDLNLINEDLIEKPVKTSAKNVTLSTIREAGKRFAEFWAMYPRKKDRARAYALWMKLKLDGMADQIVADVKSRLANDASWQDEQFIPHASTYLRNKRWEDEITLVKFKEAPKKPLNASAQLLENLVAKGVDLSAW